MSLIHYINSHIDNDCIIDEGFIPVMDNINEACKKHGVVFVVISSKRSSTKVAGAIVPPAEMSNHLVGHAVDGNMRDIKTGEYFNSKKMGDGKGVDDETLHEIENAMTRWGGRFKKKDVVHFDSGLNLKNPAHWHELNKLYNK
jgi:hypothetical protein